MQIVRMAIRNVLRARHRSWVTIGAMAFAGGIMIFYASLLEGWYLVMEKNAVGLDIGELQIHRPGFRNDPDLYALIPHAGELLEHAERAGLVGAGRLLGNGLAAAGENSAGVSIRGVQLGREEQVTSLYRHVQSGAWLSGEDQQGVVVGRKLARILGVGLGQELVLVGQAADGSLANDLYTVRGILKSVGEGIDRGGLFMTEEAFRNFFVLAGSGVHELVFRRSDPGMPLSVARERLVDLAPNLEVRSWRELQPVLARLLDISDVSLIILLLIIYAAVGILTLNGMLMGVFERIPEFGVMKALGFSGPGLFSLVCCETLFQVSVATLLAVGLGLPVSLYFSIHPIDFSAFIESSSTVAGIAFEPQWYCRVTRGSILLPIFYLYTVALVAILYPALKAALIKPIAAIHHR